MSDTPESLVRLHARLAGAIRQAQEALESSGAKVERDVVLKLVNDAEAMRERIYTLLFGEDR